MNRSDKASAKFIHAWMLMAFAFVSASSVATAGILNTRAELNSLLGGGQIFEDFETLDVPFGGQRADVGGLLNATTLFDGDGPGLVQPGADYIAEAFFWNGDNYFNLNTQTLGDSTGWRNWQITIDYTTNVQAMGLDLQGYSGFEQVGTVSVYNTGGGLISTTNVNGGFFGWYEAAGIGSVVIDTQITDNYIMIDNHGYGIVPEPGALSLAGLGLLLLSMWRRR